MASDQSPDEDIEKQLAEALACPCIDFHHLKLSGRINADDLKDGPCGPTFVQALSCFVRSEGEGDSKGMDCLPAFKDFQTCLSKHKDAAGIPPLEGDGSIEQTSTNSKDSKPR